jgi:hypothetical protein
MPVLAQAITPTWVLRGPRSQRRAEPAAGQAFGSMGTMPPSHRRVWEGMAQAHFLFLPFDLTGIPRSIN